MAVMYVRGSGMSDEDRAREDNTVSSLKQETEYSFPDGEVVVGVPAEMPDDERKAIAARIASWEKDGLIKRKQSGELDGQSLKDTRARYGPPREWDHLQLSFDRVESDSMTSDQLDKARRAVIDVVGKDISGQHRKLTISRIHTDTGNAHIDVFVHRHAYNSAENAALPADELTAASRLASVMEQINKRLRVLSLPAMSDVKKQDGRSLYEESATSDKAKAALNDLVQDAGGVPTQRTGAPVLAEAPQPIPRISDPDAAALERLVRDAERDAKAAAQRLVDAQNALEAQRQRLELRERVEQLEADVAARTAAIAERDAMLAERDRVIEAERKASAEALAVSAAQRAEVQQQLEETQAQLEETGSKLAQAAHERDEAHQRISGLEADYANAQEEIGQQQGVISTLQSDLASVTGDLNNERVARTAAEKTAVDQATRADQAEAARVELQRQLEAERVARSAAEAARDQAQHAHQATAELLKLEKTARANERSLFEQVRAGLQDMVASLKEQLQSVKESLMGVTTERDELREKRKAEAERIREAMAEAQRLNEREKAKDAELQTLRQRVADLEGSGSDNDGGSQAGPGNPKPPGKR